MELEYDFTEVEYDSSQGKRDAVNPVDETKMHIIRIDDDVLKWFQGQVDQAREGNCQTLINNALRSHIQSQHG
jgi:uncharacterized protein (DUF4415 family)